MTDIVQTLAQNLAAMVHGFQSLPNDRKTDDNEVEITLCWHVENGAMIKNKGGWPQWLASDNPTFRPKTLEGSAHTHLTLKRALQNTKNIWWAVADNHLNPPNTSPFLWFSLKIWAKAQTPPQGTIEILTKDRPQQIRTVGQHLPLTQAVTLMQDLLVPPPDQRPS